MRRGAKVWATVGVALVLASRGSFAQSNDGATPTPLPARVSAALAAEAIPEEDAIAKLVEALGSGSLEHELDVSHLRADRRARDTFVKTVVPLFPSILDSGVFRAAYARRRADFASTYRSNPHIAESLERYFPEDPRQLVADRLGDITTECRDVDFRAATHEDDWGTVRFVDPANERRSKLWKFCYRLGAKNMAAVRKVATRYQTSLSRAGIRPRTFDRH